MRWIVAALLISTACAQAQTPLTGTTGAPTASPPGGTVPPSATAEQVPPASTGTRARHARRTLQVRFDEANTTHDGHLTLEQARSKMPSVARDFAAIDTDHRGYVTVDEIKAHARAKRAAKRAAKEQQ